MTIHINIEDLLSARTVESDRIEFKAGWNPDAVYRSICAFANDYNNTGAGYILIGVKENPVSHIAMRPVAGLTSRQIAEIQKEMIGYNNLIRPYYAPRLFIEEVDGQQIIVLWAFAGNDRPYEVPEQITAKHKIWKYFIRKYASSIEARGIEREELISLSQNIPFDDRPNNSTKITDISLLRLRDYLQQVKSKLAEGVGQGREKEILRQMELISGPEELIFPKNVALMMFNDKPHSFFPYTWVEIVHFPNGPEAKEFIENRIEGPVHQQITDSLRLLKTQYLEEKVRKIEGKAEAERIWNYPYAALEETVANCIYHRNYQEHEPVTIRIEPTSITLYNCGGPDRSLKREDFISGKAIPKRYRNRRLGDFLKELGLTEGHATGLPAIRKAMQQNGSPEAIFDFDEERTWFQVTLPIHPAFKKKQPFTVDFKVINWDLVGIDNLLNQIIDYAEIDERSIAGGKADDIVTDIDEKTKHIDNLLITIMSVVDNDIVTDIAHHINNKISNKQLGLINLCFIPMYRDNLFTYLKLVKHPTNYKIYIKPLIDIGWLSMTNPDKPTSPKQQYLTTLKGRLVLELLKNLSA